MISELICFGVGFMVGVVVTIAIIFWSERRERNPLV